MPEMLTPSMIHIAGARVHNLRSITLDLPRDALIVITGVSGSGKSSLAFDTIFAEGQRRYLASLSSSTNQFFPQWERSDVDVITGLPPTISVDQKRGSIRPRSTLATLTEIADYLRLFYARAGQPHCPTCGEAVQQQSPQAIVDQILSLGEKRKVMILAPLVNGRKGAHRDIFQQISKEGFVRARVDGGIVDANDPPDLTETLPHTIEAIIDRIIVKDGIRPRLQESVELALKQGDQTCIVSSLDNETWDDQLYSARFACPRCQQSFPNLEPRSFSFNSPYGACETCDGLGVLHADEEQDTVVCTDCEGTRLQPFPRQVTFQGQTLPDLLSQPISEAIAFTETQTDFVQHQEGALSAEQLAVARNLLPQLTKRLRFLVEVGLDYLSLDRPARTLSGGEFQRARLATCLGAGLRGICYILDEPTIGLHPRDTRRLLKTLLELRDNGSTVIIVEHDVDVMQAADLLIDVGPGAGSEGGCIVAQGTIPDLVTNSAGFEESPTVQVLTRTQSPTVRNPRNTEGTPHLTIHNATLHHLKHVTAEIPLGVLTCVTGVSGSGKSSLITHTLVPLLRAALQNQSPPDSQATITGDQSLQRFVEVDQSPIGRSGRSNPATYSGLWDELRKVFAKTKESRIRGFTASRFSFNSKQGRCADCQGQGVQTVAMKLLPDVHMTCPTCRGARFNRQTLSIRYRGKSPADLLAMTVTEGIEFLENFPKASLILNTLAEVGLGYLTLGQSALTLSGGEAQRLKLATELSRQSEEQTLFVLDEPTTGLHPHDIEKLTALLQRLVDQGHSVLVIEHELSLITQADWVIDLGPEGGADGGEIIATGPPAQLASHPTSHTAAALREWYGE